MDTATLLFALLRAAVCGEQVTDEVKTACTPEALEKVYILAAKHDLAHLPGHVLGNLGLPDSEPLRKLKGSAFMAVYRYEQLNHELEQIYKTLEQAEIPFIPLKGAVIRKLYPEPWMRTSCDIDVLIHEEDMGKAIAYLIEDLHYVRGCNTPHDVSFFAPNGVHLELHFDTIEETELGSSNTVLSTIWEDALPEQNRQYHKKISDDMFYFYHISHMAKHVLNGGCGVRPFLDIWILRKQLQDQNSTRSLMLDQCGLLRFAEAAEKLSEIWFSNFPMNRDSLQFSQFILGAGVYGSMDNRVVINRKKQGGKLHYALSRIFLPFDVLKHIYPVIEAHKILTPVFQIIRWFQIVFSGRTWRAVHELRINAMTSPQEDEVVAKLLLYLGLNKSNR